MEYRIDDLLDEYFDTSVSMDTMAYTSADTIKEMTMNKIKHEGRGTRRRWKLRGLLAAVVAAMLLIGTAVASCVTYFSFREVEDTEDLEHYYIDLSGTSYAGATYAVELNIAEDVKSQENMVYYRLNWLPTEYDGEALPTQEVMGLAMDDEGWLPVGSQAFADLGFIRDGAIVDEFDISRNVIAYQINVYPISEEQYDQTFYFSGDVTLIKQDNWNGWGRIELTVDHRSATVGPTWEEPVNYLLLYDPEENILVNICGMMDLNVLEEIAENLEFKVSDEPIETYYPSYEYGETTMHFVGMSRG